jgi:hypothetical protein
VACVLYVGEEMDKITFDPSSAEIYAEFDRAATAPAVVGSSGRDGQIAVQRSPGLVAAHPIDLESLGGLKRGDGGERVVTEIPVHALGIVPVLEQLGLHHRHQVAVIPVLNGPLYRHWPTSLLGVG